MEALEVQQQHARQALDCAVLRVLCLPLLAALAGLVHHLVPEAGEEGGGQGEAGHVPALTYVLQVSMLHCSTTALQHTSVR